MENINIEEMRNSIIFMKKHPEYKKVVTNLLLYNDEEIFFFFNSKIKDENFITNLMKYIEGTAAYFNAKDDVKSRDKLLNLYSKCVDTIKKIDEPDTHTATNENQPYQISLDKKTETKVLLNYEFWNDIDEKQGNKNIFKNITQYQFLEMVKTANFSEINKTGISQRVKYNTVIILAHLLNDDEWTKQAEKNLNTTKKEVAKRTDFDEYEKLKRTFLK